MKKVTEVMGAIVLIVGSIGTIIASLVAGMAGGVGAFIINCIVRWWSWCGCICQCFFRFE